jgi:hypothetical protein
MRQAAHPREKARQSAGIKAFLAERERIETIGLAFRTAKRFHYPAHPCPSGRHITKNR